MPESESSEVAPPLTWRIASTTTVAFIGILAKTFLSLANRTTVHGLDGFTKLLDEREDPYKRERGLITSKYAQL
jgi:monolysocardiolipin acyltransferase